MREGLFLGACLVGPGAVVPTIFGLGFLSGREAVTDDIILTLVVETRDERKVKFTHQMLLLLHQNFDNGG